MSNKYQNGKIYKIISDLTNQIYIGSTIQPLYKRLYSHVKDSRLYQSGDLNSYVSSTEIIKLGEIHIILIENYPCNDKQELLARERYYIDLNRDVCVNIKKPIRNKEEEAEYQKQYRIENEVKLKEYKKLYRVEKAYIIKDWNIKHKDELKQKQVIYDAMRSEARKAIYSENKEKYKERYEAGKTNPHLKRNIKILCECGTEMVKTFLKRHYQTKTHLLATTSLEFERLSNIKIL